MSAAKWQGIHSVLVTPFGASGEIDFTRFGDLAEANIANGADALIACGSTGEFYAMTVSERIALFRATQEAAAGRVPVIAGVSDLLPETVYQLCREARSAGLDGVLAMPPVYAMPDPREISHFFAGLVRASDLPVMLYNSPRRAGVSLTVGMVEDLAKHPNIAAIKDSSGDIVQVSELARRLGGRLQVFVGYETMIRSALAVGAVGVVAMAHQLSGRLVRSYFDACKSGRYDEAAELEPALFALYECFKCGSYYAGIKATMNALGQPVGSPRAPLLPFTDTQMANVRGILERGRVADAIKSVEGAP